MTLDIALRIIWDFLAVIGAFTVLGTAFLFALVINDKRILRLRK